MRQSLFLVFIIVISLAACRKKAEQTTFSEPMRVSITETTDSAGRTQRLSFETVREYPYYGHKIINDYRFDENMIRIMFKGNDDGTAAAAFGPATATFEYRDLEPGNYRLALFTEDELAEGGLRVSKERFEIFLPAQSRITAPVSVLNRTPDNTIFGRIHYPNPSGAAAAKRFIDSLQSIGARPQRFLPGTYQGFDIDAAGEIVRNPRAGSHYATDFIYRYAGSDALLRDFVKNFDYRDSLYVTVQNTGDSGSLGASSAP